MAAAAPSPAASALLNRGLMRQLLKHRALYNAELRPLLQGLPKHTYHLCRFFGSTELRTVAMGPNKDFPPLQEVIRDSRGTSDLALEGLRMLSLLQQRLAVTKHKSLTDVPYELDVGDVVRHTHFGHVGVVAARLPVCLESDEWITNNLGSLSDGRLTHPWYLVLVGCHAGLPIDFVRYGSQLTHKKLDKGRPIGFHRLLPMYFRGYDTAAGRYIPRGETIQPEQAPTLGVNGEALPAESAETVAEAAPAPPPPTTVRRRKSRVRSAV